LASRISAEFRRFTLPQRVEFPPKPSTVHPSLTVHPDRDPPRPGNGPLPGRKQRVPKPRKDEPERLDFHLADVEAVGYRNPNPDGTLPCEACGSVIGPGQVGYVIRDPYPARSWSRRCRQCCADLEAAGAFFALAWIGDGWPGEGVPARPSP
jgi:hypothetical protein